MIDNILRFKDTKEFVYLTDIRTGKTEVILRHKTLSGVYYEKITNEKGEEEQ